MKRMLALGVLALGLGISSPAASQSDIQPGQWQMSVEFAVPADPGFKQPPISRNQCLTAADARDPGRLITETSVPGATGCAFSDKKESSGHLEFAVKCEGLFAIGGHGSVDYTPTSLQGTLDLDFNVGEAGAKRTGSVSRFSGRRIGDC
jgi:Protein of unknown function (DUF3617)